MKKVWFAVLSALLLGGCRDSASIGIIGGADGPTSIIVAGGNFGFLLLALLVLVAVIAVIIAKR